jgi:hypothetical protein
VLRQDYVKRLIEQLGQALARIAGRQSEPEQVLDEVQQAKALLPLVPGLLENSSTSLVIQLVGSAGVLRQLAELYRHEAHALEAQGQTVQTTRALRRCLRILEHLDG